MRRFKGPSRAFSVRSWVTVAPSRALAGPLEAARADHADHVGLHQELQHALRHHAEEVLVAAIRKQPGQRWPIIAHRGSLRAWWTSANSTLAADPDDHLSPHLRPRHLRGYCL